MREREKAESKQGVHLLFRLSLLHSREQPTATPPLSLRWRRRRRRRTRRDAAWTALPQQRRSSGHCRLAFQVLSPHRPCSICSGPGSNTPRPHIPCALLLLPSGRWWLEKGRGGVRALAFGSVGSYGAGLADGSEYRGGWALPPQTYIDYHQSRLDVLCRAVVRGDETWSR